MEDLFANEPCFYTLQACRKRNGTVCTFLHKDDLESAPATTSQHDVPALEDAAETSPPLKRRRKAADHTAAEDANSQRQPAHSAKSSISPPPPRGIITATLPKPAAVPAKPSTAPILSSFDFIAPKNVEPVKALDFRPRNLTGRMRIVPESYAKRMEHIQTYYRQLKRLNDLVLRNVSAGENSLLLSEQTMATMALDFEENMALKKGPLYRNEMANELSRMTVKTVEVWQMERKEAIEAAAKQPKIFAAAAEPQVPAATPKVFSKVLVAPMKKAVATPAPKKAKEFSTGLTQEEEIAFLSCLQIPKEELPAWGFVTDKPGMDAILEAARGVAAAMNYERCDRCGTRFQVFPGRREEDGALTDGRRCTYHWGKLVTSESGAKSLACCREEVGGRGCVKADNHVFKVTNHARLAHLSQYAKVPAMDFLTRSDHKGSGPVCIDGEMGYTTKGFELIRLTATAFPSGAELFDVLVRPFGIVIDLNSRFSGVFPAQLADAAVWDITATMTPPELKPGQLPIVSSPRHARDLLFRYLTPTTALIGHGLDNDLGVLRIIHDAIVDTAYLFRGDRGSPKYRKALKRLMWDFLGKKIQEGNEGHDSKEDARAAGALVRYKIKELAKK